MLSLNRKSKITYLVVEQKTEVPHRPGFVTWGKAKA